jgi:hypothetical protein
MAKKRATASDDITLYDIAPAFQDRLAAWLIKKPHGVIVDIGATPEAFKLTLDPGGESTNASFEDALHDAMGSRSRTKYIDPELEGRIHEFLVAKNAHLTFGASKDGEFNVVLSNPDARGVGTDEDFEIALMLAEEEFWQNMPARPLPPGTRAALEHALKPRLQREEESHEALRRALLVPRPELDLDTGSAPVRARPKRPAKKPVAALASAPSPASVATPLGPSPSWFIPKAVREEIREDESRAQLHKALMEPRAGLEANASGEHSKSGTYRVYSTSPFSGERAPHGYVWGVMGYGQGEGAYEGAAAQAEDMRQEGFKRVRNLGTMVEWLQPERMHLETNPGVGTYPRGRFERARTPHDVNVPEGGSWRIRLAGNDIVPIEYRHAADAEDYARRKYGPSGWTVEWHNQPRP